MTAPRLAPPLLATPRATAAITALASENLALRLMLALRDPASADLRGTDPARFAFDLTGGHHEPTA